MPLDRVEEEQTEAGPGEPAGDLKALCEDQQRRIEELEELSRQLAEQLEDERESAEERNRAREDEIEQLNEIIRSQEAGLEDQKRLMESQRELISQLGSHLSASPEDAETKPPSRNPGPDAPGSQGGAPRRRSGGPPRGGPPPRGQPLSARTPREEILAAQRLLVRERQGPGSPMREPPRPRPNSALGKAPRPRSLGAERAGAAASAPLPGRGARAASPGQRKHAGDRHPPGLPSLSS